MPLLHVMHNFTLYHHNLLLWWYNTCVVKVISYFVKDHFLSIKVRISFIGIVSYGALGSLMDQKSQLYFLSATANFKYTQLFM